MSEIAVVGAGPAGLTLAAVLQRNGISATVLERDSDRDVRAQGGSLDLHLESGQHALAAADLMDGFRAKARPQGEQLRILEPDGTVRVEHGSSGTRPEIDRAELRDLLLDALAPGTVRWGAELEHAEPHPDGGWQLVLTGAPPVRCDLLVGADGASSRIRNVLTDATPHFRSIYVELAAHDIPADLVGPGSLWVLGGGVNLAAQREGSGRVRVAVSLRGDESRAAALAAADEPQLRAVLRELTAGWHPDLTGLLDRAEHPLVRVIRALPPDTCWPRRPGVTLVGDAAHLMPPVGEGANQGMLDAAELATAIVATPDDLDAALDAYETAMFERIEPIARDALAMEDLLLGSSAADDLTRFFQVTPSPAD